MADVEMLMADVLKVFDDGQQSTLDELAAEFESLQTQMLGHLRATIYLAKEAGDVLRKMREATPHGSWGKWFKQRFPDVSGETERNYRRIARRWSELETHLNENLTIDAALRILRAQAPGSTQEDAREDDNHDPTHFLHQEIVAAINEIPQREDARGHVSATNRLPYADAWRTCKRIGKVIQENAGRRKPYSLFLDSGAYGQLSEAEAYADSRGDDKSRYYDSDEFFQYLDAYCRFLKAYRDDIDLYANLDVIGDPERSLYYLTYMEKLHGLKPVPVIHYGTDPRHLNDFLGKHEVIGFGGLAGCPRDEKSEEWVRECFDRIADFEDATLKRVKVHGFGVMDHDWMLQSPWYSVDATTWLRHGATGEILVPMKSKGAFVLDQAPRAVNVTQNSEGDSEDLVEAKEWVEVLDVPWEEVEADYIGRHKANLRYYHKLQREVRGIPKIYFSGDATKDSNPESILGSDANIMLTFTPQKPSDSRFQTLLRLRASESKQD